MKPGFHTIDYAGLSPEDRAEGSILLGGSAAEFHDGDPADPEAVLEELGLTPEQWDSMVVAVIRWGDPNGPAILEALDAHTGSPEPHILPYAVSMVADRFLAAFNEAPGLSASRILEIESEYLEDREREALAELDKMEFDSTLAEMQARSMMPMRALILPWNEETAAELMLRNNTGTLGDLTGSNAPSERRICLGIVGKRVFNEGISMHLDAQPDRPLED